MFGVGVVGSDHKQGAVEPWLLFGFGKKVAKRTIRIENRLLEAAPQIALLGQFKVLGQGVGMV